MKNCILTIIKNEHQYLEEWIDYHIKLGIDHLFIFQDIDSLSHSYITDKYDKVSLFDVGILLNDEEMQRVLYLKKTHNGNPQHIYFKNGLSYIKDNYDYDWCYVIDNDEFLPSINLTQYQDYDAIVLPWKCYGANGLINKPDYKDKGVIDTYTEEVKGFVPASYSTSLNKTCYNLTKYNHNFYYNNHIPNICCNYIKLEDTYIRHYITKSWEEYVWKRL